MPCRCLVRSIAPACYMVISQLTTCCCKKWMVTGRWVGTFVITLLRGKGKYFSINYMLQTTGMRTCIQVGLVV